MGVGIDTVVKELVNTMPESDIIIMDKDHITTHLRAVKARDLFYKTPGSIMVGTEMALPYLNEKIENTAVVSLDSFFAIPDFRIHEKIFHILLDLRSLAETRMLVQTRQKDVKLFEYALKGNLVDFYRDEIEERKVVNFPPFTTAVKLTVHGEKQAVKKQMEEVAAELSPYEVAFFEASRASLHGEFGREHVMHGLLLLPKGEWPDLKLAEKLRRLPPSVTVKIDPDTLL